MKTVLTIFGLLAVSLSTTVALAASSNVDCLWYSGGDDTMPLGNVLRIERAKVQGKDRLTLFANKDGLMARYVMLGSFQMGPKGFIFKGTETASHDDAEISLNERTLNIQIGGMKSSRSAESLGDSQNGKECRQGMYPERLFF